MARGRKKRNTDPYAAMEEAVKAKPVRKKRKPMTEEQRAAAAERLKKARAARKTSDKLSYHESLHNLPDDHEMHPNKVKEWLKEWKEILSASKNDPRKKTEAETYIKSMNNYLTNGVWTDNRWGAKRENRYAPVCVVYAYDKDGNVKRSHGVYYPDIDQIWGVTKEE